MGAEASGRPEDGGLYPSAEISSELKIVLQHCGTHRHRPDTQRCHHTVRCRGTQRQVCVEVLLEYPSLCSARAGRSCCPDRTTQLLELSCAKLCVGRVCLP
nr:ataxin-1-like [Salvelinus alpinus]